MKNMDLFATCRSALLIAAALVLVTPSAFAADASADSDKLDIKKLEDKYWSAKDDDFTVVQNRAFTKAKRYYISLLGGIPINDPYSSGNWTGASVGYHFSERYGMELNYLAANFKDNDATSSFQGQGAYPNHNTAKSITDLQFNYIPLYAKMSFLDKKIIYFDMGLGLILGQSTFTQNQDIGSKDVSSFTYGLSIYQHYFLSSHWAIKFDYRNTWTTEERSHYKLDNGTTEAQRSIGNKVINDSALLLGLDVLYLSARIQGGSMNSAQKIFIATCVLFGGLNVANADDLLSTTSAGRAPAKSLKMKSSKVPTFEMYKGGAIPRLDIGEEASLAYREPAKIESVKPLVLKPVERRPSPPVVNFDTRKAGITPAPEAKVFSHSKSTAPEIKALIEIPAPPVAETNPDTKKLRELSPSENQLLEAQIVFEKQNQPETALGLLVGLLDDKDKQLQTEARYAYALAARKLGLHSEFRAVMMKIAQDSKNKEWAKNATEALVREVEALEISDMKIVADLVAKYDINTTATTRLVFTARNTSSKPATFPRSKTR